MCQSTPFALHIDERGVCIGLCLRAVRKRDRRSLQLLNAAARRPGFLGFRGRGSIEQRAMPWPGNQMQHRNRNRCKCPNKNNGGGNHCNRSSRMHHHADRAMIGIGGRRMDVSHLDERHQGQQQQTNDRRGAHSPGAALARSIHCQFTGCFHRNRAYNIRIHILDLRSSNLDGRNGSYFDRKHEKTNLAPFRLNSRPCSLIPSRAVPDRRRRS